MTAHDEHAGHAHSHGEGAGHSHLHDHAPPADFNRAFVLGVTLNVGFVIAEVIWGLAANSLALVSDAGHNASDVLGLLLAWGAMRLAKAQRTERRTYGLRRTSILAALVNAGMLLLVTGAVTWEAITRLRNPEPVVASTVMWVASLGIVINATSALLFLKGRKDDVNIRGAYMHLMADAAVSLGVVVAGLAMKFTGWLWLDPVVSIVIGIVITIGTWGLLRESLALAMDSVPEHIDPAKVAAFLRAIPGVTAIHDLHIWAMSTTETALTVHLIMPGDRPSDTQLRHICDELREHHRIGHSTIQVEQGGGAHPDGHDHDRAL